MTRPVRVSKTSTQTYISSTPQPMTRITRRPFARHLPCIADQATVPQIGIMMAVRIKTARCQASIVPHRLRRPSASASLKKWKSASGVLPVFGVCSGLLFVPDAWVQS